MENDLLTSDLRGQRTLATVVFTDCVGFSARMSVDEDHTLDLIRRDLKQMKQTCGQYEGRVLKSTGDGLLMCFISAVKAVECAMEIQKSIADKSVKLPPEDALEHRIGIHLADMFITETDVMGNGVNIAARLQTEAEPGGICISQTVYDVIKASLHVESEYLGPRELKNIREVVPVYRILTSPESKILNPYTVAIRNLEQSRNLLRIKKLLLYACKNTWESDHNQLNLLNLSEQIQDVMALAPTPERLKFFLDAAVRKLSKPAEYTLIANIITKEVSRLYPTVPNQDDDPTCYNLAEPQSSPHIVNALYDQIAVALEATGNGARIKKLAFYVCRRRWENDQSRLDNTRLQDLLAELHQSMPTLERLTITIEGFVQTLSKQAEYTLLANAIISQMQRLYEPLEASLPSAPPPAIPAISTRPPEVVAPLEAEIVAASAPPPPPPPTAAATYALIVQALQADPNLLRLKKLMFYVCHRKWENDAAKLESLNLERLIQTLHQMTRTSEQLESALEAVVKTLNKPDEYRAIAQTLITSFERLYPKAQTPNAPVSPLVAATPPKVAMKLDLKLLHAEQQTQEPEQAIQTIKNASQERQLADSSPPVVQDSPLSLFDFRLGIMKYANPLLVKILIFSALHSDFGFTDQDWSNLKRHELDSLLRHLLGICKTYTDLEACLYAAARRSTSAESAVQTADVIIKCLRPFYLHSSSTRLPGNPTEPTQIKLDDFEEATQGFASFTDDDGHTRVSEPTRLMDNSLQLPEKLPSPHTRFTDDLDDTDDTENAANQAS